MNEGIYGHLAGKLSNSKVVSKVGPRYPVDNKLSPYLKGLYSSQGTFSNYLSDSFKYALPHHFTNRINLKGGNVSFVVNNEDQVFNEGILRYSAPLYSVVFLFSKDIRSVVGNVMAGTFYWHVVHNSSLEVKVHMHLGTCSSDLIQCSDDHHLNVRQLTELITPFSNSLNAITGTKNAQLIVKDKKVSKWYNEVLTEEYRAIGFDISDEIYLENLSKLLPMQPTLTEVVANADPDQVLELGEETQVKVKGRKRQVKSFSNLIDRSTAQEKQFRKRVASGAILKGACSAVLKVLEPYLSARKVKAIKGQIEKGTYDQAYKGLMQDLDSESYEYLREDTLEEEYRSKVEKLQEEYGKYKSQRGKIRESKPGRSQEATSKGTTDFSAENLESKNAHGDETQATTEPDSGEGLVDGCEQIRDELGTLENVK